MAEKLNEEPEAIEMVMIVRQFGKRTPGPIKAFWTGEGFSNKREHRLLLSRKDAEKLLLQHKHSTSTMFHHSEIETAGE